MLSVKKRIVFVPLVIALLVGAVLLWQGQSSAPAMAANGNRVDNVSVPAESAADSDRDDGRTSSRLSGPSSSAQPEIEQSANRVTSAPVVDVATSTMPLSARNNRPAQDETPPTDSNAPRLSPQVLDVITEVQALQQAGRWEDALNEMNELYQNIDSLNPFERATLLNFYTNNLARLEMWQESITAFNMILQLPDLRPDLSARALLALGQLHARVGEGVEGVAYLTEWLNHTAEMESMEALTPRVTEMLTCLKGNADDSTSCTL